MPHDEIQLNRIILPKERRLTRRGIVYYSWVKSSRRNCFYLLPLKKCEKYVRLAGGAAFISAVLFLTFRMFYEPGKWRDFLIAGGVLNGPLEAACGLVDHAVKFVFGHGGYLR